MPFLSIYRLMDPMLSFAYQWFLAWHWTTDLPILVDLIYEDKRERRGANEGQTMIRHSTCSPSSTLSMFSVVPYLSPLMLNFFPFDFSEGGGKACKANCFPLVQWVLFVWYWLSSFDFAMFFKHTRCHAFMLKADRPKKHVQHLESGGRISRSTIMRFLFCFRFCSLSLSLQFLTFCMLFEPLPSWALMFLWQHLLEPHDASLEG